jgi:hypothetical protein
LAPGKKFLQNLAPAPSQGFKNVQVESSDYDLFFFPFLELGIVMNKPKKLESYFKLILLLLKSLCYDHEGWSQSRIALPLWLWLWNTSLPVPQVNSFRF